MLVTLKQPLRTTTIAGKAGESIEVSDDYGAVLVRNGFAEAAGEAEPEVEKQPGGKRTRRKGAK